jgi:hypothetical protein
MARQDEVLNLAMNSKSLAPESERRLSWQDRIIR